MRFSLIIMLVLMAGQAIAHPATGIVVDSNKVVYFSDLETIWRVDARGHLSVFRPGVRGRHVHELSIDEHDNIYGADISYEPAMQRWISSVWKMKPSGEIEYLQEPTHLPPRGLSIWRDRQGNMYAVEQNNHLKKETLVLRRSPDGVVSTLAGSDYGFVDGKGREARFQRIDGIAFGPDESLYVTDLACIRQIQKDGTVKTIASGLDFKTDADQPKWMGGVTGLSVDSTGNVYAADTGRRRVLKIIQGGGVTVLSRAQPPYFPNGVFTRGNEIYVLEIGFTLPNAWSGPRVRKITSSGEQIIATVGINDSGGVRAIVAQSVGISAEKVLAFLYWNPGALFGMASLSVGILIILIAAWLRRRKVSS